METRILYANCCLGWNAVMAIGSTCQTPYFRIALCLLLGMLQGCDSLMARILRDDSLPITVEQRGGEFRFHIAGTDGEALGVEDLAVHSVQSNGALGACYWSVQVDPAIPYEQRSPAIMPIIYGQAFPGLRTEVPATPLKPGRYLVLGEVFFMNREPIRQPRIGAEFVVFDDGRVEQE